jgi:hypothetical protein
MFLGVAYELLLSGKVESPLRVLWQDLRPALAACAALVGVALPADRALSAVEAPAPVLIAAVGIVGAAVYLGALRWWYPATARDVLALVARVLPDRLKFGRMHRVALAES